MSLQIALAIALATGSAPEAGLCGGIASKIDPDMQIHESDLDKASAISAADWLRDAIGRGDVTGDYEVGILNKMKIIQGHSILQRAKADRNEFGINSSEAGDSTKNFCTWLTTQGFWFD